MNSITRSLHTRSEAGGARPSVTPLYQNSAFDAGSTYFYTRKNNPNVEEFEDVVRHLEGARHGVAVATGMAAIRTCLEQLRPGDTMVINGLVYGCSFKLVQRFCERFNVRLEVLDLSSPGGVESIPAGTRLVLFETPTNPFLRTVDIERVASKVKASDPSALVVVDNTWATPLYQHPLSLGADVSLHSATKYMSGHSDVMGGMLLTDRDDLAEAFRQERFYSGAILDPHAAWLLRRSMQTFGVRLERQGRTTAEMREFLAGLPQVQTVYYPEIEGRQLRGYGGILFIELRPDLVPRYPDLVSALRYFGNGTGMACVTSMIAQPYTGSHASMTDAEKDQMGLSRGLVRLCFGLEEPEDLRRDLLEALASIDQPALSEVTA
ncbi:MAG TPA: PLP-dependent aspartate aminotransferase family protein [Pyrinomonadaceae bacterium]|jgi:cystathionine gamma-lyase/cystathionine gamma-lyase/homocysteine desulfhydrase